ncbi:branched-chain-amino-acid transaminase [Spirochaeta thermophila]|uniref:Branched-chain-amino-acid aminotransferase n=1 Tax=Winmispira thermophila (strain ATCC 49972 / DSM 6192 / RI 19.B1) TaxID=665571 RepID=E0RNF2_WINT6|nr:branched-chain-amino-acid transaminase [Spirochaeta thermophila]ADN01152.1 probable branched-chain-amino-acid aminotransferase [Spirochaeta thermophila DSM 6192]
MAKSFSLSLYPWVYKAQHQPDGSWQEAFEAKVHLAPEAEATLPHEARMALLARRNSFPDLPLVNYSTQYGFSVFEGLKAFPQKDGSLKLFRPEENARRMRRSMEGLKMPGFPEELFVRAVKEVVRRNKELGFYPRYNPEWEKDGFLSGHAVYVRPFSYTEPGIGLDLSHHPWVVIITTPVGPYFEGPNNKAVTTDRIRATPKGTGWIKCSANYVIPTLVKKEANEQGYMEAIFLDAREQRYVEEGSSCNIFFYLKNGTLVTPELGDTILPGITRKSVLALAAHVGIPTEERKISIDEVLSEAKEVFVTGTAAGISYIESITHKGKTVVFNNGKMGEVTRTLLLTLKGIQYGAKEDPFGWMIPVE